MPRAKRARVVFHQSRTGWRFRILAPNGRVLAVSSQAFARVDECHEAYEQTKYALIYAVPEGGPPSKSQGPGAVALGTRSFKKPGSGENPLARRPGP